MKKNLTSAAKGPKSRSMQLTLATGAGEVDLKDAVQKIRTAGGQFETTIASMLDYLDEPLKGKFLQVKGEINTMLAGLPATDAVPAANQANQVLSQLLGILQTAQSMMSSLSEVAKTSKAEMQSTRASLTTEVEAKVETTLASKITSGELFKKADVDKLISDATATAVTSARAAITTEQKRVTERTAELTTAGLPIPAPDLLGKEDADFKTAKDTAAKRFPEVKDFGLPADRVLSLCWGTEEKSYTDTLATMQAVKASASKTPAIRAAAFGNKTSPVLSAAPVGGLC